MKYTSAFLLLLALSYFSVRPLFSPGFFPMHDDVQPTRVHQMRAVLAYGQFPVRWVSDLGYGLGYPIFNFYAPLPYYLGALGMFAGMDALTATKFMMGIGMVMAAISMYFLAQRMAGAPAGIASAVLYLYAPYHAVNLYVRGAVGELWAYGFLPFLGLGIYELIQGNKKRGMLLGCVGLAAVLLSHNILGMITLIFFVGTIVTVVILYAFRRHGVGITHSISLISMLLLGIGLSAFFTVPAIMEKGYTKVDELTKGGSDFRQHFVYPDQLWDSPWGYAGSAPGRADGMSFKIGKVHLVLAAASSLLLLLFYRRKKVAKELLVIGYWLLVVFLISVFLMLPVSQFLWEIVPGFGYIQYPWRFMNLVLLCMSILASLAVSLVPGKWRRFVAVGVVMLTMIVNAKYFTPREQNIRQEGDYTDEQKIRFDISKISDEYMPPEFLPPADSDEVAKQLIVAADMPITSQTVTDAPIRKEYRLSLQQGGNVIFPVAYFPRWQAADNGERALVGSHAGKIQLSLNQGDHAVVFTQRSTTVEHAGNAISLFSVFLLGYVSLSGNMLPTWGRNHPSRS